MLFDQGHTAEEQLLGAGFIFLVGFSVFILLLTWLNIGWVFWALVLWMIYKKIVRSFILPEAKHSDHCPVGLEIQFQL